MTVPVLVLWLAVGVGGPWRPRSIIGLTGFAALASHLQAGAGLDVPVTALLAGSTAVPGE